MRWWIPSLLAVVVLVELAPDARGRSARSEVAPYQEVKPYSAREKALLRDLKQDQQLYRRGVEIFNNTVDHLIERAYLNEKHLVERKYRKNLEEASRWLRAQMRTLSDEFGTTLERDGDGLRVPLDGCVS